MRAICAWHCPGAAGFWRASAAHGCGLLDGHATQRRLTQSLHDRECGVESMGIEPRILIGQNAAKYRCFDGSAAWHWGRGFRTRREGLESVRTPGQGRRVQPSVPVWALCCRPVSPRAGPTRPPGPHERCERREERQRPLYPRRRQSSPPRACPWSLVGHPESTEHACNQRQGCSPRTYRCG
jgi:hypothetical protein